METSELPEETKEEIKDKMNCFLADMNDLKLSIVFFSGEHERLFRKLRSIIKGDDQCLTK